MSSQSTRDGGFDFHDLFVLDLANNHQGSVEHGLNIIHQHGAVLKKHGVRGGIKFQFRQLDSFIHPTHKQDSDNKHIPRFLSTCLDRGQFQSLFEAVRGQGLMTICTPFDEESVDVICDMGFDIIKIASCSAGDWPLLERVASAAKPVIASTGGLLIDQIDDLVSFFDHRAVDHAIMHCVSIYPTPAEACNLGNIAMLRERYPGRVIGWSTHEDPADTVPVQVAIAKGAEMYERHVGLEKEAIKLNAYSSTPEQVDDWIAASRKAIALCGSSTRLMPTEVEAKSIDGLRRGVFSRKFMKGGATVDRSQIYFAMPYTQGQLSSGEWRDGITIKADIKCNGPLMMDNLDQPAPSELAVVKSAIHEAKALLNEARITLNSDFEVEYSHHYGLANFRETGAIIINCINREYCKKIIVQLPHQSHPAHYHHIKEETFQVLHGVLHLSVEGHVRELQPGESCLIQPGVWHSFWTDTGCVFEEISTTHFNNDSFYKDKSINNMKREERKTVVDHWGRFQIYGAVRDAG